MSSDEVAIRVSGVSKHYLMFEKPEDRLKQMIVPRLSRLFGRPPRQYFRDFTAVNNVSFEVKRGETVGIIGRNGSGKSTMLQMVVGTLTPSSGTIEVHGRIAALLELGAGFNPEFTGRENVYLNAAILGLTRAETDQRFDAIAAFADIGLFIDQPVKTYSSGMYVRLAFAVAINVDPDILVVDEALSVGDEAFQRKCFARIEQIRRNGATVLFVSHGAQTIIQLCDRAILFDRGEAILDGRPKMVTSQYSRLSGAPPSALESVRMKIVELGQAEQAKRSTVTIFSPDQEHELIGDAESTAPPANLEGFDPNLTSMSRVDYESAGANIVGIRLVNAAGESLNILQRRRRYTLEIEAAYTEAVAEIAFGMLIKTVTGIELAGTGTNLSLDHSPSVEPGQRVVARMTFDCNLAPGSYFLNCGAGGRKDGERKMLHRILDALAFRVVDESKQTFTGYIDLDISAEIELQRPSAPN